MNRRGVQTSGFSQNLGNELPIVSDDSEYSPGKPPPAQLMFQNDEDHIDQTQLKSNFTVTYNELEKRSQ